jgi:hypothetical protein
VLVDVGFSVTFSPDFAFDANAMPADYKGFRKGGIKLKLFFDSIPESMTVYGQK